MEVCVHACTHSFICLMRHFTYSEQTNKENLKTALGCFVFLTFSVMVYLKSFCKAQSKILNLCEIMKLYHRWVYGVLFRCGLGFSCWLHWDGNCSGRFKELLAVYVAFKFSACGVIKTCLLWYLSANASWKNVRSLCVVSQLNHKASAKPLWSPSNEPHCLGIPVSAFVFKCHPSSATSTCIYQSVIDRPNISCFKEFTRGLWKDLLLQFSVLHFALWNL